MKKSKSILIGFILLWIVGFLVVWGITLLKTRKAEDQNIESLSDVSPGLEPASEGVSVRCFRISRSDFKDDLPVMGTIKGALEIELKFEINGVAESVNFREGDVIYKGDLIATLDKKDAELKVEYAKSKLKSSKVQALAAKKKLQIFRDLYEIGGIIKAKLEEIELEVQSAELQIESAEVELRSAEGEHEKTDLYAPRDGVLGSRDAEIGEFVTPNDKIATLYDTMEVFVELGIVEKDIDKIMLDQPVVVMVDAYPGVSFVGTIDNIFPLIEGKSRTLTVRVRIQNESAMLLPGMFARAMITVAEFNNAIVVPSLSVERTDEGYQVFTVEEDDVVSARPVEVAYVTTDYTVIEYGLYEGDLVVTYTPQELNEGMSVNIIEVQESILEE